MPQQHGYWGRPMLQLEKKNMQVRHWDGYVSSFLCNACCISLYAISTSMLPRNPGNCSSVRCQEFCFRTCLLAIHKTGFVTSSDRWLLLSGPCLWASQRLLLKAGLILCSYLWCSFSNPTAIKSCLVLETNSSPSPQLPFLARAQMVWTLDNDFSASTENAFFFTYFTRVLNQLFCL